MTAPEHTSKSVVFLQHRTHQAGAQTCLLRMLTHPEAGPWNPVVICDAPGWLSNELQKHDIRVLFVPFPRSRSATGRLWGNRLFVRRVIRTMRQTSIAPLLVHGNDHEQGILARLLADACQVPSAIHLRSGAMTPHQAGKYRCMEHDAIIAVSRSILRLPSQELPGPKLRIIHDGLLPAEIHPPRGLPGAFPASIVAIGTPSPAKGWTDLIEAFAKLQPHPAPPPVTVDFTGDPTPELLALAARTDRNLVTFRFTGRLAGLSPATLAPYQMAVIPSRVESFGMAALEVLAAGLPVLASRTGIIEEVIHQPEFLFDPGSASSLSTSLARLMTHWRDIPFDIQGCQDRIRQSFLMDTTLREVNACYSSVLASGPLPGRRPNA